MLFTALLASNVLQQLFVIVVQISKCFVSQVNFCGKLSVVVGLVLYLLREVVDHCQVLLELALLFSSDCVHLDQAVDGLTASLPHEVFV